MGNDYVVNIVADCDFTHALQTDELQDTVSYADIYTLLKEEMAPPKLQAWLEQTLLAERNRNWVKQWPGLPNESFIVVGALHLYGEQGLLALLEQQGWRITPLTEPAAAN